MNKRYQVFVSSTYIDLQEERAVVMQALLELDCMPAGMELFPAANEEQWNWIKRVIDESDYYLVIIGGRYGTISKSSAQSYTEMEYRYAVGSGKPVIGFLHENPERIEVGKTELAPDARKKLAEFRKLVEQRLCKYYANPADLGSKVSRSITQLIKRHPALGWIKANEVGRRDEETIATANRMRRLGLSTLITRAELEVSDIAFANAIALLKRSTEDREFLIYGKTLEFISRQILALNDGLTHGIQFRLSLIDPTIHPWDVPYSRQAKSKARASITTIRKMLQTPDPLWTGSLELRATTHSVDNSFSSFVFANERVSVLDFDLGDDLSMQCSLVFRHRVDDRPFAHHLYTAHRERFAAGQHILAFPPRIKYAYVYGIKSGKVAMIRKHGFSTWELPGGVVEPDEVAVETAKREFLEETGYDIVILRSLDTREPDKLAFIGKVRGRIGQPDASEIASIEFFPFNKLPEQDLLTFPDTGYENVLAEIDRYLI
jgi:8-oxo-dGTP pyrophosphatase MutT (NUDIX family)